MVKKMKKEMYKLTKPQKNIWNTEQFYQGTNTCNICGSGLIKEQVEIDLLKKAMKRLVLENDSFRTRIVVENGEPMQYFADFADFEIEVVEIESMEAFKTFKETFVKEIFPIFNSNLFTFKIAKFPNGNAAVVLNIHHIISDSWSMGIIIQEIVKIYHCFIKEEEYSSNTYSYTEFIEADNEYAHTKKYEKDKIFWKEYLQNVPESVSIPSMNRTETSNIANRITYFLETEFMQPINDFCKTHKISTYSFFMSIYSLYLASSANVDDVVLGTPVLNRTNFKEKNSTGIFISTIPFRTHINGIQTFIDFATNTSVNLMSVFRHQRYCYENIITDVREENRSISNLYDCSISYQITKASDDSACCETDWAFNGTAMNPFTVHIYDLNDTGNLKIDYDFFTSNYTKKEIESIHFRILHMIKQILENPSICIKEIQFITKEEKAQILYEFNNHTLDCPLTSNIVALWEKKVEQFPHHKALVYKDKQYTYLELNAIVNQLAKYLLTQGFGKNDIIGVHMNKTDWFIISILAIIKIGAAYLPMHLEYPLDRVNYILQDSQAKLLLTDMDKKVELTQQFNINIISPEALNLTNFSTDNINTNIDSMSLCYVIYTSGSTGKPKGVCVTHSNLINFLYNSNDCFTQPFTEKDNCLSVTNISFDVSVQEIFVPLCFGATLVLYPKNTLTDIPLLCEIIEKEHITYSYFPPNILEDIYAFIKNNHKPFSICKLLVGVEMIKNSTLNKFYTLNPNIEIINGYGPSETTICATFYRYHPELTEGTVPIGYPLKNNHIYLLNFLEQLQPIYFPGEICISGANVTKGYLNQEEMTKKSFVTSKHLDKQIIYKTGDIGYFTDKGCLSFIGRKDSQIKYRGHRIELNEINNGIKTMSAVSNAITIFQKVHNIPAICSYVCVTDKTVTEESIKVHLAKQLPYYMIPTYIILVKELPITANGKIDTKNLPAIVSENKECQKPTTLTEIKLHNILCKLLKLEKISITEKFFDLGMDSLLAIRFSLEIYKDFKQNLTITELFEKPTILDLAKYLDKQSHTNLLLKDITKTPRKACYELSSAQKRIYYASKMAKTSLVYNVSGGIFVKGFLDRKKVERIINKIIAKNTAFRTYFAQQNSEVKQFILEKCSIEVKCFDEGIMLENDMQRLVDKFPKHFDLDFAPLLRVELHYINNDSLLLIDSHHIILDGSSLNILITEFCHLYEKEEVLEKELEYIDYSTWENTYLSGDFVLPSQKYWENRFKDYEIPVINLPYDKSPSDKYSFTGHKLYFSLQDTIFKEVHKIANQFEMSDYMVFLAVLYILLYIYTGQENIIIGSPMEARPFAKLENVMGMFVNNLVLNAKIDTNRNIQDFLQEVKEMVLQGLAHQPYPSDKLQKDLKIPSNISLFDVVFAYQNANHNQATIHQQKIKTLFANNHTAKFPITVEIVPDTNSINFEYHTDLFKEETIQNLFEHYVYLLENLPNYLQNTFQQIPMLTPREQERLEEFNKTEAKINDDTVVSIFEDIVAKQPKDIAVICDDKILTYQELNEKANCLAHHLIAKGIQKNDIVSIMANRSLETIVGMLGILKAGAAFLNVDPTYPMDRTQYYLEDCKTQYVVTQKSLREKVKHIKNCIEMDLDNEIYQHSFENPNIPVNPTDLSYVIYTSGSTGLPKGVLLHQLGFANMVKAMGKVLDYLKEGNKHCIASVTSTPFDIFVYEIFVSLTHGLKVLMANNDEHRNPLRLDSLIKKYQADVMTVTPSLMKINYDNRIEPSALSHIKHMVFGGEPLPVKFVQDLRDLSEGVTVYNIYGPSEITVLSNVQNLTGEDRITTGPPIMNTQIHILDKNGNRVPIGVAGEIYISGVQVGLGYLNKPEMTQEKFLDNPFGEGKMYRSGDIGRWTFDGKVQVLGRIDHQIKLHGLRVELGEIEAKMEAIEGIISAVVNKVALNNREFLCGYYVCDKNATISTNDVKSILRKSLPYYMVPTYLVELEKMPYSINRKIDRKALPIPDGKNNREDVIKETLTKQEKKLLKIWKDILQIDQISSSDNFFDIGGDSISAINMQIEALRNGFSFEYIDIFNFPTIKQLAKKLPRKVNHEFEQYDYEKINQLLEKNKIENIATMQKVPIGNILLIGGTGYLGSHLIETFLTKESGDIYCLVRQKDNMIPNERLKNTLSYYFGHSFYEKYKDRIHILEGDITKTQIGLAEKEYQIVKENVQTIINSGAIVKHFGQRDLFDKINVEGTKNVIALCLKLKKRLLHISTVSVSGNGEKEENVVETKENRNQKLLFSEKDLYISQHLDNVYAITKFEAEKIVLEAILDGLDAQILRIGNIASRYRDGLFQRNISENAFAKRIKSFMDMGVFPDYSLQHEIELTPVDLCADAILHIGNYKSEACVFHIYNTKLLAIQLFVDTLEEMGIPLLPVSQEEMVHIIEELLQREEGKEILAGIIHDLDKDKHLVYTSRIRLNNEFSEKYLNKTGFSWKPIDKNYIQKYINYFRKIKFLK